ncbi:hypothetical protein [Streptomyces sp. NPDC093707]|uniref:hypothetical protein n=1 Tax=Streptomyces sp. NPDC093707 TaxID=3154984 RepID=UPI00344EAD16
MKTTPKDRRYTGAQLTRELIGLLLVAAGTLSLVATAYSLHPLVGLGLVAATLLGAGAWTLYQQPQPNRRALALGVFCTGIGSVLALNVLWALSPAGAVLAASAAAVGTGLWLSSGEVR